MCNKLLKILLVEDNLAETELIEELLAEVIPNQFEITAVKRLSNGIQCLLKAKYNIILLDLSLPDSQGIDTIVQMKAQAPTVPIVILTALNDETVAIEAVRQGAQDYLVKGKFEGELLVRAIRYAVERQHIQDRLRQQAERERLMGSTIERIRNSLNLKEILATTVEEVRQFLKTDRVAIYQCQSNSSKTIVAESANLKHKSLDSQVEDLVKAKLTVPIWQSEATLKNASFSILAKAPKIPGNCCSDRTIISEKPSQVGKQIDPSPEDSLRLPITSSPQLNQTPKEVNKNQLWGELVALDYSSSRKWQQWEIDFLQQLASQVAIAIQQS